MALEILPVNNGPTYSNGLLVQQPVNTGGLAIGFGATGYLASVQLGPETFHDHFAAAFNAPGSAGLLASSMCWKVCLPFQHPRLH